MWLEDKPVCVIYPILFDSCSNKRISVYEVWSDGWVIHFQTIPQGVVRTQWYELATKLNRVSLRECNDLPLWWWTANKVFSVKSVYNHMTKNEVGVDYKRIWKTKLPEKIKIFMWLLEQKVVLTKDNMVRRKWQGCPACYLCGEPETNYHLFFSCPIVKVVWGVVARCFQQNTRPLCYEQYWVWVKGALPGGEDVYMLGVASICWAIWKALRRNALTILMKLCILHVRLCAIGQVYTQESNQQAINEGVDLMIRTAIQLLGNHNKKRRLMISDGTCSSEGSDDRQGSEAS
jgi:hypothetical protein